jgi:peptidoglycan/xylan/chitin deacetylase (PgdA/CDA1 family)
VNNQSIKLHGVSAPAGSARFPCPENGLEPLAPLRAARLFSPRIVAAISGPEKELAAAAAGLPEGAAQPEAIAARLRARGFELEWGEPVQVKSADELLALCRERGRSSVEMQRVQPSLARQMQIGAWFDGTWRVRALRRLGLRVPFLRARRLVARSPRRLADLADLAFWLGAAERCNPLEWQRLTRTSYVAFVYHRFAGEAKDGQERIDISPRRFRRQLAALRIAGCQPFSGEEVIAFHGGGADPPGRAVAITVDDGMRDCVEPLRRHARWRPQLFVPTRELGGAAHWIDGEPVASWEEVASLSAAGVGIGSHAQHHQPLTELSREEAVREMEGSWADLQEKLPAALPALAFPNGGHDAELCAAAAEAGYAVAFTTEKGRNGVGAAPWALRRVSIHAADGALAALWKASTGEPLPRPWLRLRERFGRT